MATYNPKAFFIHMTKTDLAQILADVAAERDSLRAELARLSRPENRGIGDGDIAALFAERDALREALRGVLHWFGDYPELVPNMNFHADAVESALASARKLMEGQR